MNQQNLIILQLTRSELEQLIEDVVEKIITKSQEKKSEDRIITRKEIAEIFKVSLTTINSWSRSGKLKRRYMGARVYFLYSEVESLLKKKI